MSDHLPECPMLDERYPKHPLEKCDYCEMLRACEQRVRLEDDDYAYVTAQAEAEGRMRGWNEALDTARERIMRLPYEIDDEILIDRDEVIGWIDGLRQEP